MLLIFELMTVDTMNKGRTIIVVMVDSLINFYVFADIEHFFVGLVLRFIIIVRINTFYCINIFYIKSKKSNSHSNPK